MVAWWCVLTCGGVVVCADVVWRGGVVVCADVWCGGVVVCADVVWYGGVVWCVLTWCGVVWWRVQGWCDPSVAWPTSDPRTLPSPGL